MLTEPATSNVRAISPPQRSFARRNWALVSVGVFVCVLVAVLIVIATFTGALTAPGGIRRITAALLGLVGWIAVFTFVGYLIGLRSQVGALIGALVAVTLMGIGGVSAARDSATRASAMRSLRVASQQIIKAQHESVLRGEDAPLRADLADQVVESFEQLGTSVRGTGQAWIEILSLWLRSLLERSKEYSGLASAAKDGGIWVPEATNDPDQLRRLLQMAVEVKQLNVAIDEMVANVEQDLKIRARARGIPDAFASELIRDVGKSKQLADFRLLRANERRLLDLSSERIRILLRCDGDWAITDQGVRFGSRAPASEVARFKAVQVDFEQALRESDDLAQRIFGASPTLAP
ncbi:MAG: hypothetical protein ACK55O_02990 [Phycisphaerales bacterium]|jgi:hypothetical protein|nr:hypothetical protein [Phycisphaeraceae bacterium]